MTSSNIIIFILKCYITLSNIVPVEMGGSTIFNRVSESYHLFLMENIKKIIY